MHFYGASHEALMATPIKTFWFMNQCIDRIQAQKDMRSLSVAVCGQGGGAAAQEYRKQLVIEQGDVFKLKVDPLNAERDEEGFAALKSMIQ
jgi:hypothetical protein